MSPQCFVMCNSKDGTRLAKIMKSIAKFGELYDGQGMRLNYCIEDELLLTNLRGEIGLAMTTPF